MARGIAVLDALEAASADWAAPAIEAVDEGRHDAYRILMSTLLSLRTKDETTIPASERLFALAPDVTRLAACSLEDIEKAIYPVGFYHNKAKTVRDVARLLLERWDGQVPRDRETLLSINGVGRKTANLVLAAAFGIPAICVDTHVHRISNRLGWCITGKAEETERALEAFFPETEWNRINYLLVQFGQNLCVPSSPKCSLCPVRDGCPRVGVGRSR